MSVSQNRRSPGCRSVWNATSSAIFTRNPPCTCTAPFGRPVVPLVYAMNSGCSLSSGSASRSRPGCAGQQVRPSVTSRPSVARRRLAREPDHDQDVLAPCRRGAAPVGGLLHRHDASLAGGTPSAVIRTFAPASASGRRPRRRRSPRRSAGRPRRASRTPTGRRRSRAPSAGRCPTASPAPTPERRRARAPGGRSARAARRR